MTAKQKKLFLLTSMMSVFVMAVAVLFTGGKISLSPLNVRGSGTVVNGSITWNYSGTEKTAHDNNEYSFLQYTSRGTGIYLYSIGSRAVNSNRIFSSKKDSNHTEYGVYITTAARTPSSLFEFQSITSISIKTSASGGDSGTIAIYGGDMSTTPLTTKTVLYAGATLSYTPSSTMRYFVIAPTNNNEVDIESITINYSCEPGGVQKSLSSISISGPKTSFNVDDAFNFGGTVTAHYSDSSIADVTSYATFSGYDLSEYGEQDVTVSYTEEGVTKTATYSITVSESVSDTITFGKSYGVSSTFVYSSDTYQYAYTTASGHKYGAIVEKYTADSQDSEALFAMKGSSNFIYFTDGDINTSNKSYTQAYFASGVKTLTLNIMYTYTFTSNLYVRVWYSSDGTFSDSSAYYSTRVQQNTYSVITRDLSGVDAKYVRIGISNSNAVYHIKDISIELN